MLEPLKFDCHKDMNRISNEPDQTLQIHRLSYTVCMTSHPPTPHAYPACAESNKQAWFIIFQMRRFISLCIPAQSHQDICPVLLHFTASNDFVSGQRMPLSNCRDLDLRHQHALNDSFCLTWPILCKPIF